MEAVITSVGEKAGELAFDLIKREVSYLLNYESNVESLKEGVEDLKDTRQRVQRSVNEARRKGEEIYRDVEKWLRKVDELISEEAAAKLEEDEEKAKKVYFNGFCPNLMSRYQLSKKAEEQADAIAQLLSKGRFDRVSYRVRPAIEPRNRALKMVMQALENNHSNKIGLYGICTLGMTKLVREVARLAKEEQLYDEVILVAVKQTQTVERIQNEIAQNLGLEFHDPSLDARRVRLRDRLKKEKKVLVILDGIWLTLDLQALGIPSQHEHMGCKILLTSTKFDVLSSMGIQNPFAINVVQREAWNLLKHLAADIVERSDMYCTTIEVAQRCAELPIAIATVANALKDKRNLFEWKNALQELRRASMRKFQRKAGDADSVEVAKGWVWPESDRVEFVFGSLRVLVDFGTGSFRVLVSSGSNYIESEFFQVGVTFKSGLFQVWTIPDLNHFGFKLL